LTHSVYCGAVVSAFITVHLTAKKWHLLRFLGWSMSRRLVRIQAGGDTGLVMRNIVAARAGETLFLSICPVLICLLLKFQGCA
jgi:hypothetical protein